MSRLGFERETGFVFEGRGDPRFPVWPTPTISHATLISGPADFPKIPTSFESAPFGWLFQEDSFDPVSRVRRGRLFQKMGGDGWGSVNVEAHPASHSDMKRVASNGLVQRSLSIFIQCQELLAKENRGIGSQLALGAASSYSLWRIVQVEITLNEDVMLTLRAESALGVLPEIDVSKIPPESVTSVKSALSRVLDAAYRELPSSVVDQCRNAATVVISRWYKHHTNAAIQQEKDLGEWITTIRTLDPPRHMLIDALDVIRRLHVRGKDNEVAKLGLRPIDSADAELAVHLLGFILRELGWTASIR